MRAAVVALGDLGRSARMRYHAQALAACGVDVDLVGFEGTPLPGAITAERRITVHRIAPPRLKIRGGLTGSTYAAAGLFDATRVSFRLWRTKVPLLRKRRRPHLRRVEPHRPARR